MPISSSYGVHPFWPANNDWFYGDAVFLVEPLLRVTATPLLFTLQTKIAKGLVGMALAAGVVLSFATRLVPVALAGAMTALVALLAFISRYSAARTSLATGIGTWLGITALFFLTGLPPTSRRSHALEHGLISAAQVPIPPHFLVRAFQGSSPHDAASSTGQL